MNINKVRLLENVYDVCGGSKKDGLGFIYDASTPRGKCPLYKTLISNKCSYDCKYCNNRASYNKQRSNFEPEELAKTFIHLQKTHKLEGLFLSSAVCKDPDKTTEKMLQAVRLVRNKYYYKGYIHFKILPGVSFELIKQASEYADRLSINIECPNKSRLTELSSNKEYKSDILRRQAWIKKLHPNQTTQMVIGAADETDFEVLKMMEWEYKNFNLRRIYYCAFRPLKHTPLENKAPESLLRQNRLYNVDFLIKKYNYNFKEFKEIMEDEMLPKRKDPKLALALHNLEPIEINEAEYIDLIKVPGIGLKTAEKIIHVTTNKKIKKKLELKQLGVILKRAEPFIKIDGSYQRKLSLF